MIGGVSMCAKAWDTFGVRVSAEDVQSQALPSRGVRVYSRLTVCPRGGFGLEKRGVWGGGRGGAEGQRVGHEEGAQSAGLGSDTPFALEP